MKDYETLLKEAPEHHTPEFLQYLRDHNKVVYEDYNWIVIENYKYHTDERPWYTAFTIKMAHGLEHVGDTRITGLMFRFPEFDLLLKAFERRSVKRFHVHLIKADDK